MSVFWTFAGLQALAYFVLVANIRAIAHLNYPAAVLTESSYLFIQWTVVRRVVVAESPLAMAGYIVGGTAGSLLSMWLTRGWG